MRGLRDILFSLAITFILCEFSLRVFAAFYPQPYFYSEHSYRFQAQPNQKIYGYNTNSRGFYDSEHSLKGKPDQVRILSIGDSFTFGVVPRNYNFNTILENELVEDGYKVELINMGIPATAPRQYFSLLNSEGKLFEPNIVLLNFFIGNDFEAIDPVREWKTYSNVASLISYVYSMKTKVNLDNLNRTQQYDDEKPAFTEEFYIDLETKRSWSFKKDNAVFKLMYDKTIQDLKRINTLCKSIGAQLVVSIIPDELQVNYDLNKKVSEAGHFDAADDDFDQPNKMLATSLTELGIPYLDLLESIREKSASVPLYKPNDSHWNIAGNKLAGEALSEFLKKSTLLTQKMNDNRESQR